MEARRLARYWIAVLALLAILAGPAKVAPARVAFEVRAADSFFEPREFSVEAGTTVTWKNTGSLPHAVTSIDESFVSGAIAPGESYSYTFTEPGAFTYYCEYHAQKPAAGFTDDIVLVGGGGGQMVGTVRVTAAKEAAAGAANDTAWAAPAEPATSPLARAGVSPAEGAAVNGAAARSALPETGQSASPWIAAGLVALVALALGVGLRRRRLSV